MADNSHWLLLPPYCITDRQAGCRHTDTLDTILTQATITCYTVITPFHWLFNRLILHTLLRRWPAIEASHCILNGHWCRFLRQIRWLLRRRQLPIFRWCCWQLIQPFMPHMSWLMSVITHYDDAAIDYYASILIFILITIAMPLEATLAMLATLPLQPIVIVSHY